MRANVIEAIEKEKIIVIVRGVKKDKLLPLAEAMYKGGIRLLEITYDAKGEIPDEETAANIKLLSDAMDGKMYIGAGTVLTEKQVELTHNAGGKFIISPDAYDAVIKKTRELGMVSMPGALTASEAQAAHRYGADFIKLFPITNMGPEYIKAVKAPLSHLKFLAVGGVNLDNISDYLKVGISGFGLSSNIIDKKAIEAEDYDKITSLAKLYVKSVTH